MRTLEITIEGKAISGNHRTAQNDDGEYFTIPESEDYANQLRRLAKSETICNRMTDCKTRRQLAKSKLQQKQKSRKNRWLPAEFELLRRLYASEDVDDSVSIQAKLLKTRSKTAICAAAHRYGLALRKNGYRPVLRLKRLTKEKEKLTKEFDEKVVRAYQETKSVHEAGKLIGMCGQSVLKNLNRLGVKMRDQEWTEKEVATLRTFYSASTKPDINLIAKLLNKTRASVAVRASRLGLTDRKKGVRDDTHAKIVARQLEHGVGGYQSVMRGYRSDLGDNYFRSRWEANIARYLTFSKRRWQYEAKTFWFLEVKSGIRSYTPDFYLPNENIYIEVKGYMDQDSKTKLNRMQKYYPKIVVEVWDSARYESIEATASLIIPNWERKGISFITGAPTKEKKERLSEPGTICACGCEQVFNAISYDEAGRVHRRKYSTDECRIKAEREKGKQKRKDNKAKANSEIIKSKFKLANKVEQKQTKNKKTIESLPVGAVVPPGLFAEALKRASR
jgi:hypothetical protein